MVFYALCGGELITLEVEGQGPLHLRRIDSLVLPVGQVAKGDRIAFLGRNMYSNETPSLRRPFAPISRMH